MKCQTYVPQINKMQHEAWLYLGYTRAGEIAMTTVMGRSALNEVGALGTRR